MKRILIVDDKAENLFLLRVLLKGNGFEVEEARDGAQALVLARAAPPGLIISDLLMPVMDGYTLLRECRADARLRAVPFVVYTATYTEPRDEQLALDMGADAFIVKPADPGEFLLRINEVLLRAGQGQLPGAPPAAGGEAALLEDYGQTLAHKLEDKMAELERSNRELGERNRELQARNDEWVRFERALVNRELRMIELKREVDALCAQLGEAPRYGTGSALAPAAGGGPL